MIGTPTDWSPHLSCPEASGWSEVRVLLSSLLLAQFLVPVLISLNIWHVDSVVGA